MRAIIVRKLSDDDYNWVKQQADSEQLAVETWLRRLIREMRLGVSPVLNPPLSISQALRERERVK